MEQLEIKAAAQQSGPTLNINFTGIGIFALSLTIGLLARFCVPDAVMYGPKQPLSDFASYMTCAYVVVLVLWMAVWFRSPRSPRLTVFGAAWTAIAVVFTAHELGSSREGSLIPALAICFVFSTFTFAHWLRMRPYGNPGALTNKKEADRHTR